MRTIALKPRRSPPHPWFENIERTLPFNLPPQCSTPKAQNRLRHLPFHVALSRGAPKNVYCARHLETVSNSIYRESRTTTSSQTAMKTSRALHTPIKRHLGTPLVLMVTFTMRFAAGCEGRASNSPTASKIGEQDAEPHRDAGRPIDDAPPVSLPFRRPGSGIPIPANQKPRGYFGSRSTTRLAISSTTT